MTEERTDAPKLDLSPVPGGEDALQVGPADVPAGPSDVAADAFSMRTAAPKPPSPAAKPSKPVSAEANAGVVAALMGRPIPKVTKKPEQKSALAAAIAAAGSKLPAPRATETPTAVAEPVATLDAVGPVATESVIDFDTPAEAEIPSAAGAPPASPGTAEPVSAIDENVIAPEPFVAFELTQTALPDSLVATAAVVSGVPQAAVAPLAVAFAPLPVAQTAGPAVVEAAPEIAIDVAVPVPPAAEVIAPAVVASPARSPAPRPTVPSPAAVEAVAVLPKPPAPPIAATPGRRPASPVRTDPPKRPIPVAPVWPAEPQAARPEPEREPAERPAPTAQSPRPNAQSVEPALPAGRTGAWWTIPLTFVGIAIVACSVIIPAADETRRDAYELAKIEQDVDHFQKQSAVNADFLDRVNTDATLAERLAMRQLHQTRAGVKIAPLAGPIDAFGASPFAITKLDPPQPLPAYRPTSGPLGEWFLGDKRPQQMAALGLLIAGIGVMLGGGRRPAISHAPSA